MFVYKINPRFSETDALGHINNTVVPVWFEEAREPIFKIFTPDLDIKKWRLIIAKFEVDFLLEIFHGQTTEIKTYFSAIGNSSMTIAQEVWQQGKKVACGKVIMVHYDYQAKKSVSIPDDIKNELLQHLE